MAGGGGWGRASVSAASSWHPLRGYVASTCEVVAWREAAGMRGALPLWGMAASPALKQGERHQNHACSCHLPHRVLRPEGGSPLGHTGMSGGRGEGGSGPFPLPACPGLEDVWPPARTVLCTRLTAARCPSPALAERAVVPGRCWAVGSRLRSFTGVYAARASPSAPEQLQIGDSPPANTLSNKCTAL